MRDKQVHAPGEENVGDAVGARCFVQSSFVMALVLACQ